MMMIKFNQSTNTYNQNSRVQSISEPIVHQQGGPKWPVESKKYLATTNNLYYVLS